MLSERETVVELPCAADSCPCVAEAANLPCYQNVMCVHLERPVAGVQTLGCWRAEDANPGYVRGVVEQVVHASGGQRAPHCRPAHGLEHVVVVARHHHLVRVREAKSCQLFGTNRCQPFREEELHCTKMPLEQDDTICTEKRTRFVHFPHLVRVREAREERGERRQGGRARRRVYPRAVATLDHSQRNLRNAVRFLMRGRCSPTLIPQKATFWDLMKPVTAPSRCILHSKTLDSTIKPNHPKAASLRTDICPQRKESSSTSHARNPFNLNFLDSAQSLMVRRWRLNWLFPYPKLPPNYWGRVAASAFVCELSFGGNNP
jgi:hypothetical protein